MKNKIKIKKENGEWWVYINGKKTLGSLSRKDAKKDKKRFESGDLQWRGVRKCP